MEGAPLYNILVYNPIHIYGNLAATYEYCNLYIYVSQAQMLLDLDFGFLSELGTRLSMILSNNLQAVMLDLWDIFGTYDEYGYIDWYFVGLRLGLLWKEIFDVNLE